MAKIEVIICLNINVNYVIEIFRERIQQKNIMSVEDVCVLVGLNSNIKIFYS